MDMMLQVNLIFSRAQLGDIKTTFSCPPRWLWSKRKQSTLKISCQVKSNSTIEQPLTAERTTRTCTNSSYYLLSEAAMWQNWQWQVESTYQLLANSKCIGDDLLDQEGNWFPSRDHPIIRQQGGAMTYVQPNAHLLEIICWLCPKMDKI